MSEKLPGCRNCAYYSHGFVPSEGPIDADLVVIGDSPWKSELKQNRPLIGPAGEVFNLLLESAGLDRRDVYICNTVKCLPEALGQAHPKETVELCTRLYLKRELARINPKLVVPMGNVAIKALGIKDAITSVRGVVQEIEYDGEQYTVLPTYHPSFLNRRPAYAPFGEMDFKAIKYYLDNGHEQPMNNDLDYRSVTTEKQLMAFFADFEKAKYIAWDTETTGLDFRTDKILSMQFSFAAKTGYCVPFFQLPYTEYGGAVFELTHNAEIITKFYNLLHDTTKVYFFHGGKFDFRMMNRFFLETIGLPIQIDSIEWYDTMAMYGLLDENTPKDLKAVSRLQTDLRYTKEELAVVKDGQMKRATLEEMTAYGCLSYESRVVLADGSLEKISQLVQKRYSGHVQCFDGKKMTTGKVVGWHRNPVQQQDWYKIITPSTLQGRWGYLGAEYTPDHEIYTSRGRVQVRDILVGQDKILTGEMQFSKEQMSVFLGSLLGDGGLNSRHGVLSGFRFGQTFPRLDYARWKADVFSNFSPCLQVDRKNQAGNIYHQYVLPYSRYLAFLRRVLPIKSAAEHPNRKLRITPEILEHLGVLGLAVWYQDDGSLGAQATHISATKVDVVEIELVKAWLFQEFGIRVSYYKSKEQDGIFHFSGSDEKNFHDLIFPFIHSDCAYKSIYGSPNFQRTFLPYKVNQRARPFYETITGIEQSKPRTNTENVRWCITVEDHGNFLTQDGIVSNCKDSDATRRIALKNAPLLRAQNLWGIFARHDASDMRIANILFKMELFGAPIDYQELQRLKLFMQEKLAFYQAKMEEAAGHPFNPNSDPQLRKILFEEFDFPIPDKKTGTGLISVDKFVIADLMEQFPDHPFLEAFRMHRNYTSIEETFVRGLEWRLGDDGRLHPDFRFTTIVSGRVACYQPNLTNIPREREFEEGVFVSIRRMFAPPVTHKIICADAMQIEFKTSAILSGDKALIHALFVDREDFHSIVARALVSGYEERERLVREYEIQLLDPAISPILRQKLMVQHQSCVVFLKAWRTKAKNFNFGRNYGAQTPKLAETLGITEEAVAEFLAPLAERFPDFEYYLAETPKRAIDEGELISVFQRRRHFPMSLDEYVQASQGRQGSNFESQAAAAYTIRAALVRLAEAFERVGMASYPFNLVYDEILDESPNEEVQDALEMVATEMLAPVPELDNHVFGIELGVGQNWQDAEKSAVKLYSLEDLPKVKSAIALSLTS